MEIQTAGQQKYYDFIEERAKSLRLGMIIWISLLAAALLAILAGGILGYILEVNLTEFRTRKISSISSFRQRR